MSLVRCPTCGRVTDGKMCFACGYEWPEDAVAPSRPPPTPAVSPSQAFKTASPASYPTAAVVSHVPSPARVTEPLPPDEIDLDVDFDDRRASESFSPPTAPVFGSAPAFPTPSGTFGSPPPAFPSASGSFAGAGAFGAPPPAFPSPSGAFGAAPPLAAFPSASGAFAQPAFESAPAQPSSPPAPVSDPWGAPSALSTPPTRPPSMKYPAPAAASTPSWVSNPTLQVSASVAASLLQGLAPAPPAGLSGLFDGLNQPPTAAPPLQPQSDEGEINFTLEPGSDVEASPFAEVADGIDLDLARPASSRSVPIDFAEELVDEAEPVRQVDDLPVVGTPISVTSGFAELDAVDFDTDVAEVAPPAASTFDPFATAEPEVPAPVTAAAPVAPSFVDESSFADVEADLAGADAQPLDGEAAFDALDGLDDLGPVSLDDDASLEALAELDREIAAFESEAAAEAPPEPSSLSSAAPYGGPTLSNRVGTLAESLEESGRIADAALLYEVQAVLAAGGR